MVPKISPQDILSAQRVVRPHIWRTPLAPSAALSKHSRGNVFLKLECWQHTGSFKVRGALNRLDSLPPEAWSNGVVTASAGNHGLGVAYASRVLGLPPSLIYVPEDAPASKLERLAGFDCQLQRAGIDYDSSHALAEVYAKDRGALYLSAYDDPVVIAGQGTAGLEIMEDFPKADVILVPVGGGGLIAGLAVIAKAICPQVRIVGVQPEASPAALLSLRDGHPYETYPAGPTICDGLAGGFGRVPYQIAASLIDEVLIVPEAAIRQSVAWLVAHEQMVVEGSGAIAVAPLLLGSLDAQGQNIVAVLTGRNLDSRLLQNILKEHPNP